MTLVPMHDIQIVHRRWQEIDQSEPDGDNLITVHECQDCGARRRTLHLDSDGGPRLADLSGEEWLTEWKKLRESFKPIQEMLGRMTAELLDGTKFPDIESLLETVDHRYQGQLSPEDLTSRQLDRWINTGTREIKQKGILAYKQGLVCNRCDSLFKLDRPTLDHINGDRNDARLTNLQLLCSPCHDDKNAKGNEPDERDISPFSYHGSPCIHRVRCDEILSGPD